MALLNTMAKLTAAQRKALPNSAFAGPDRSFPIEDAGHAEAALAEAHNASDPNAIRKKVHKEYPSMGKFMLGTTKKKRKS